MSKEIAESIGQKRRPRRRVSRARREAFRRKKIDTGSEYFHPLIYFVGLFVYLEMIGIDAPLSCQSEFALGLIQHDRKYALAVLDQFRNGVGVLLDVFEFSVDVLEDLLGLAVVRCEHRLFGG